MLACHIIIHRKKVLITISKSISKLQASLEIKLTTIVAKTNLNEKTSLVSNINF
jgi:hypothetical protein